MAAHPLAGVDLKLSQASDRLRLLDEQAIRLLKLRRKTLIGKEDPSTGDYVYRVPDEYVPSLITGLRVGVFAHFLRSALDNMLWQLVMARGGTPMPKQHQFPIYEELAEFEAKSHRTTRARWETAGITPGDFALIKRHQPFKRGKYRAKWHPLALLAHLNNVDKHRYVHPRFAAIAIPLVDVNPSHMMSDDLTRSVFLPRLRDELRGRKGLYVMDWPDLPRRSGVDYSGSDDDPAEVARVKSTTRPKPKVKVEPGITMDVSFSDRERPVASEDLYDIMFKVREVIDHFRPVIG